MIDPTALSLVFQPLSFSRNRIDALIDAADTSLTDRSSLRYALTLLVPTFPQSPDLGELTTLLSRERPPQTTAGAVRYDGASFRIDELLDGFLSVQKPSFGQSVLGLVPTLTMPYAKRETVSGGTPAVATSVSRARQWVYKGGINAVDFASWGSRFFDIYLRDTRQHLTWQPPEKTISTLAQDEQYLYYLLNFTPTPSQIRLRADVEYYTGQIETRTLLTLDRPPLNAVVCCPAGYRQLGFHLGTTVRSYKLWLANENNQRLSQVRTYRVDTKARPYQRFLLFDNSLGGFDTLRLLGQADQTTTVRRTLVEVDIAGSAVEQASLQIVDSEGDSTITVSTGFFERNASQWSRYIDELLLAKRVYLITDRGHEPLVLSTTSLLVQDDNADVLAHTLVFTRANADGNFSQLPATSPLPARPMAWRGVGFQQVLNGSGFRTGFGVPGRLRRYYTDDNSDVKPIVEKPNTPGDPDYIKPSPVPSVVAGSSPYPSAQISRNGSYKRATCAGGQEGGVATIVVTAGKYGGENAGDADALAEADYRASDTQAYADANGSCSLSENYSWDVPANQWHLRLGQPGQVTIFHNDGNNGQPDMGNTQSIQGQPGTYVYPVVTADMNFPVNDIYWNFYTFGTAGAAKRVRVYRNAVLLNERLFVLNPDGYELHSLTVYGGTTTAPASGDKWFIKYEDQ